MMRRMTGLLAVGTAASMVLTGCGGGDSAAPSEDGLTPVRIANLPVAATMVLNVADQQGFLEDHGIEADITESSELATFIPALGKQYDIVMTTPSDFLSAATKGFDIMAAGGGWADGAGVISAEATTIDDLDGTEIATNSLTGLQYAMLEESLEKNGVEAELVQIPFASQPDQLRAGEVDAATVPEPWSSALLEDPDEEYTRVFIPVEEATGKENTLTGWYSVSNEFAEANPEVMEGWTAALAEAVDWIQQNEDDFRALLESELDLSAEAAGMIEMPGFTKQVTTDDLAVYVGPLVNQEQLDESAEDLDLSQYVLGG